MSKTPTHVIISATDFNFVTMKFLDNYCNLSSSFSYRLKSGKLESFYIDSDNCNSYHPNTAVKELKTNIFFVNIDPSSNKFSSNIAPKILKKYYLIFPIADKLEIFLEKIQDDKRMTTLSSLDQKESKQAIETIKTQKESKTSGTQKESKTSGPKTALEESIEALITEQITKTLEQTDLKTQLEAQVSDTLERAKDNYLTKNVKTKLVVDHKEIEGVVHEDLEKVLKLISTKEPVFLYGPAGSGKTSLAVKSAEILGLDHYSISVNEQTTKTDFLGYFDAKSQIVTTNFRKAYQNGGMFIIDEIDAGNPNVLTVLNSALSNGSMGFPDGNVEAHKDFVCVCTANTTGNESNIQYIGRNILDAATLDRFLRKYVGYSESLEQALLSSEAIRVRDLVRNYYEAEQSDEFISMRSLLQFDKLLAVGFEGREALLLACKPEESVMDIAYPVVEVEEESQIPIFPNISKSLLIIKRLL